MSREMYLETIYRLAQKNDTVRSVDIARALGYTKPSVSKAMNVLRETGYVVHSHYGSVSLTEKGRKKAEKVYRSHVLLTEFLRDTLGVSPEVAEADACCMEHMISKETLDAIEGFMKKYKNPN